MIPMIVLFVACISLAQPATKPTTQELPLPDVMVMADGTRVTSSEQWPKRRAELLELVQGNVYGHLPPPGGETSFVEIIEHKVPSGMHRQYKITCGPQGKVSFVLDVMTPQGDGKFPVILRGDWCWGKTPQATSEKILSRGYALAEFNRCELAQDNERRETGLYLAYPEGDFGAAAAWAWGFHRCVDVLTKLPYIDAGKVAIVGHSRGGKAALFAGATDERIALTIANNSGAGGAGSFKYQPPDAESLARITTKYGFWFSPKLKEFAGKEGSLPLDLHFVKALVAPRALLTNEGLDDKWANPSGTLKTHVAAKEVFRLLGAEEKLGIFFRPGKHEHGDADWMVMLDFADQVLLGKKSDRDFASDQFAK